MRVAATVDIRGLLAGLESVKGKMRNTIIGKAIRAGGKSVAKLAKSFVKVGPSEEGKHIRERVKVSVRTPRKTGVVVGMVKSAAPQSHLVEGGRKASAAVMPTASGKLRAALRGKKAGTRALKIRLADGGVIFRRRTAAAPPHKFLLPALVSGSGSCQEAMAAVIAKEIAKLGTPAAG